MLPVPEPVIRHHGPTIWSAMREWSVQNRVPPVLLLTGTAGCGKRSLAYWLAEWILCEKNGMSRSDSQAGLETLQAEDDPFTANLFGDSETPDRPHLNRRHPQTYATAEDGPNTRSLRRMPKLSTRPARQLGRLHGSFARRLGRRRLRPARSRWISFARSSRRSASGRTRALIGSS